MQIPLRLSAAALLLASGSFSAGDELLPAVQNTIFSPSPPAGSQQPPAVTIVSGYRGAPGAAATPRSGAVRLVHAAIGNPTTTATAINHLDSYADDAGLPLSQRSPSSDFDGDGLSLLSEFAFNLDPVVADAKPLTPGSSSGTPSTSLRQSGGQSFLTITYLRKPDVVPLETKLQFSLTLKAPWSDAGGSVTELSATTNPDGSETVTAQFNTAVGSQNSSDTFLRVETTYTR